MKSRKHKKEPTTIAVTAIISGLVGEDLLELFEGVVLGVVVGKVDGSEERVGFDSGGGLVVEDFGDADGSVVELEVELGTGELPGEVVDEGAGLVLEGLRVWEGMGEGKRWVRDWEW